ncbi:MAG: hypothetical protein OER04_08355 [Cyclobacteriaceae bacterium]|nr:hypothetical protein [Cyclobacteriaceae bacterium]
MEYIGSGATAFLWIVIVLLAFVIGISTTDILKLKKKKKEE